jgi:hypothetical protein
MAKTIDEALALFAAGKSPRECEKLTRFSASTISRKAKERGIIKGSVTQLITDSVRIGAEIGAQDDAVKELIQSEVAKQLAGMEFYATNARKALKLGMLSLINDPTTSGSKTMMETMKTGMIVEGLVPFYPNATVINNTNAQQNNITEIELVGF